MIEDFLRNGAVISTRDQELLLGWGNAVWSDSPRNSFYFPDFFLEQQSPWLTFEHTETLSKNELLEALHESENQKFEWKTTNESNYRDAFNKLKHSIHSGDLLKGVPYVMFQAQGNVDVANSLKRLLQQPNVYTYGFWNESEGLLGGTPELLFECCEETIDTEALAGTVSSAVPNDTFLKDAKQLTEHRFVVDGILESLGPIGKACEGSTRVVQFTSLKHLHTPIQCRLNAPTAFHDIVNALHPTPALGAYPKEKGREWLKDYAKLIPRGRYGAPVGYHFNGKSACYVAIRNIQWNGNLLSLGAGGGVVSDSQLESEWKEIFLKASAIQEQLAV